MGTFKQSESVAMWVQFFLLFGMPFMDNPGTTMDGRDVRRASSDHSGCSSKERAGRCK